MLVSCFAGSLPLLFTLFLRLDVFMVAFLNEDVMLGLLFTDKRVFLAEAN